MTPHRRAGAAGAALVFALALSAGLLAAGRLRPAVAQQPSGSYHWQALAASGSLAGHSLLALPDGGFLALGGEASPGIPASSPLRLSLGTPEGLWSDLPQSGDIPVSRLSGRGLLGAAAVLDPGDGRVLFTCDCADGRFGYLLDPGSGRWQALPGAEGPQSLWYPILVYDAPRDRAILIGGDMAGTGELSSAIWSYDLSPAAAGWQRLGDAAWSAPLLFAAYGVAPDGRLTIFSGGDALGTVEPTLWSVDLARLGAAEAWNRVEAGDGPSGRQGASLVFDPAGTGYLYGGYRATEERQEDLADLWLLKGLTGAAAQPRWEEARLLLGGRRPQARSGHAAAWGLAGSGGLVVHGGARAEAGQVSYLGDAWRLDWAGFGDTPTPPATVTAPASRPRIFLPWGERP